MPGIVLPGTVPLIGIPIGRFSVPEGKPQGKDRLHPVPRRPQAYLRIFDPFLKVVCAHPVRIAHISAMPAYKLIPNVSNVHIPIIRHYCYDTVVGYI